MFYVIWEFFVPDESVSEFENLYGSAGEWIELFGRAPGYLHTLFLEAVSGESGKRYLTIDVWDNSMAFENFKSTYSEQYRSLDCRGKVLRLTENQIGQFYCK